MYLGFRNYVAAMTVHQQTCRMQGWGLIALVPIALAGCGPAQDAPAAELADTGQPALTASPDSTGAQWTTAANGLSIGFGKDPAAPYVSLACHLASNQPPRLTVIRHAPSEPGAKALFAVLGNGIAARFRVDAVVADGEGWRWEETLPAGAGQFDAFTGPREIEATLPGAGMILFPASNLPREFVNWCRRNGEDLPKPEDMEQPQPRSG